MSDVEELLVAAGVGEVGSSMYSALLKQDEAEWAGQCPTVTSAAVLCCST